MVTSLLPQPLSPDAEELTLETRSLDVLGTG